MQQFEQLIDQIKAAVTAGVLKPGDSLPSIRQLDLQRWEPFAGSVFFVFTALLIFMVFTPPPRRPEAGGLGANPVA